MQPKNPSRFFSAPLTTSQVNEFRGLGQGLLKQALEECEVSAQDIDIHWKYVRAHEGLKVYKSRTSHMAHSDLLVTGIVSGTLDDVMGCVYSDDSFNFRMHSALLMPKDFLDCEVLHVMDTQDDAHPYRFNGLKWCATKWPGSAMNKHRDICYFETTGLGVATDQTTFGYHIIESFDLASCSSLEDLSIVRAKVSIRHIFRELPIGCTMVMTHCTIDPSGTLSAWMSDGSALPHLLSISRAEDVAESIRLTKRLYKSGGSVSPTSSDWRVFHSICCLCQRDHVKMKKRRVLELANGLALKSTKRHFCAHCLSDPPPPLKPISPPLHKVHPVRETYAMSSLSSLCLSEYSMDEKRSLPLLDFDNDDDEDDEITSVYSGLEFDLRKTTPSHVDLADDYPYSNDECSISPTKTLLGRQLASLTARMDETLNMLRRNKPQVDFCRSHGRVEYL